MSLICTFCKSLSNCKQLLWAFNDLQTHKMPRCRIGAVFGKTFHSNCHPFGFKKADSSVVTFSASAPHFLQVIYINAGDQCACSCLFPIKPISAQPRINQVYQITLIDLSTSLSRSFLETIETTLKQQINFVGSQCLLHNSGFIKNDSSRFSLWNAILPSIWWRCTSRSGTEALKKHASISNLHYITWGMSWGRQSLRLETAPDTIAVFLVCTSNLTPVFFIPFSSVRKL